MNCSFIAAKGVLNPPGQSREAALRRTLVRMKKSLPRRDFLKRSALTAGAAATAPSILRSFARAQQPAAAPVAAAANTAPRPHFPTADAAWATTWDAALAVLAGNVRSMPRYDHPVLVEGSAYAGIWLECAPQEGQVYGTLEKFVTTPAAQGSPYLWRHLEQTGPQP